MKLTKAVLKEIGVVNPWGVCSTGRGVVFIAYRPSDYGRGGYGTAAWQVHGLVGKTDPEAHWKDYGSKTFCAYGRALRIQALQEAKTWASHKYGIDEWVLDPFGGWQDKRVYERVFEKVKEAQ